MNKYLIALASVIHLLPHPFGVSTVGATALYAGAYGSKRSSWAIPCIPLGLGLLITGLYHPLVMLFVFGGFALATVAGRWFLARQRNLRRFAVAVVTGAGIFFLVSNFAVWLAGYYPPTAAGLVQCYVAGLAMFAKAILADAVYCGALFGLHSAIERHQRQPAVAPI